MRSDPASLTTNRTFYTQLALDRLSWQKTTIDPLSLERGLFWQRSVRIRVEREQVPLLKGEVGGADVGCGEDGEERDAGDGGLDGSAAALFAVDEAEDSGNVHAGFAGGFDCGNGGTTGGADVIDDDDVGTGFEEPFDLAAGAVGFFGFADQEALDERGGAFVWVGFAVQLEDARELEYLVVVGEGPGAGAGGVGDEGVGTHGEAADGFGVGDVVANEVVENETGEAAAFGVEGGDAAVDIVVGLFAAGEGEVSELEGVGSEEIKECGFVVGVHGPYCPIIGLAGGYPLPCLFRKILIKHGLASVDACKIFQTNGLRAKYCKIKT